MPVDGNQLGSRGKAGSKRGTVPDDFSHISFVLGRDNEPEREAQIDRLVHLVDRLLKRGLFLAIGQFPAAARQTVERRRRSMAIESLSQEGLPVVRGNGVEGRHDVVERVSDDVVASVLRAEEGASEIIQRAPVPSKLAKLGVHVQPQKDALVVVIHSALPARKGQRSATPEDRLIGRVLKIAPHAARPVAFVDGRDVREDLLRNLLRPERGPGGQDDAPVLRLAFIHPEQGVLHRHIEVGRPKIGGPTMLAVPRMRQLVSEQIAPRSILVPFGEVARAVHVLAGTVVLETDAA